MLLVLVAVLALLGLTAMRFHAVALVVGIVVGAGFFLRGMASGGSLGNARQFGQGKADVGTRIGICLAAGGIASASLGKDPPFPISFRVFYGVCLLIACAAALVLAAKTRNDTPG